LLATAEDANRPSGLTFLTRLALRIFTWASKSSQRFRFAQKTLARLGKMASLSSDWVPMPAFSGWGVSKDLLRPADTAFREQFPTLQKDLKVMDVSARNAEKGEQESPPIETQKRAFSPLNRFQQELEALGGHIIPCTSDDLPQRILEFLVERDVNKIYSWKAPAIPQSVLSHLKKQGIEVFHAADPAFPIGLTGAQAGIAETGTLVLTAGANRPSTTSLLPPIHLAVLDVKDIHSSLSSVLNNPFITQTSATNLISGPSRTADIEMTLDIGVHGPKEVHVFCIMD
jgi:L-lactate utilization protein LutC